MYSFLPRPSGGDVCVFEAREMRPNLLCARNAELRSLNEPTNGTHVYKSTSRAEV